VMRVLSLGAGVQSSVAALMDPTFDCAIFADTQGEPAQVYEWLSWLEKQLPYPVYRVTAGSLEAREVRVRISKKSGLPWMKNSIPAFVDKGPWRKRGMLGRKCTLDFKITPITRKLRELAGIKRAPKDKSLVLVDQSLGISIDEYMRAKPSRESWIKHSFPLIDLGMTRADCIAWMAAKGYPEPPRSACRFCPFHSDAEWARLKIEEPEDFARAADFEKKLQTAAKGVLDGVPYLHSSLKPLAEVTLADLPEKQQVDMFNNECEGLCGV
jgi:hypothetical protein